MSKEVELKNIEKNYGDFKASDNVNLAVEKGRLIGLLGPSGSGKTTILRMIAGLEQPDKGDIFIAGQRVNDLPAGKRGIGFVFQNYALFNHMTVAENIDFGLQVQKADKKKIQQRTEMLAELVGLSGDTEAARANAFIDAILAMNARLGIPTGFTCIREADLPRMAAWAAEEANPTYPVPVIYDRGRFIRVIRQVMQ